MKKNSLTREEKKAVNELKNILKKFLGDNLVVMKLYGSRAKGDFDSNSEIIREQITGTVAALLDLVGIEADPVRSRESILLATIFEYFWKKNQDLDLTKLISSNVCSGKKWLSKYDE